MLVRNPELIQQTINHIKTQKSENTIVSIKILDTNGKIAYSTNKYEVNNILDRTQDFSCIPCHKNISKAPYDNSIIFKDKDLTIQRVVTVLYNESPCHECHPKTQKTTGKLIIDRTTKGTEKLISNIQITILLTGLLCLAVLVTIITYILSRQLNKFISEIINKNLELTILYDMMGKLNKTIDLDELRISTIEILEEVFHPDEIDIITKKDTVGFKCITWNKLESTIYRKKLDDSTKYFNIATQWEDGNIKETLISDNGKEIYMPIIRNSINLALIIMKKQDKYESLSLNVSEVIRKHLSVAFENARLYYIAITDELTKLYTQRHFRFCLEREYINFEKFGEKFTLLLCDLDNFKNVNDAFGHLTGDSVLYGVARIISDSIRDNDLAFRYGGEEFSILLPNTDIKDGMVVAERVRKAVESMIYDKGNNNVKITISIGCASCPTDATNIRKLISLADEALYCAKKLGKNRVVSAHKLSDKCLKKTFN